MDKGKDEKGKKIQYVEIICPKCSHKEIIILNKEGVPKCPICGTQMMISELLDEGKYY